MTYNLCLVLCGYSKTAGTRHEDLEECQGGSAGLDDRPQSGLYLVNGQIWPVLCACSTLACPCFL